MEKLSILLVEDDFLFALNIEMLVTELGYELLPIQDSVQGAKRLLQERKPDLAMVDYSLNGDQVGTALIAELASHGIPYIFMTSNVDPTIYNEVHANHPSAFLIKPFNLLTLKSAIETTLNRKALLGQEVQKKEDDFIFVSKANALVKLFKRDISYVEADGNYCYLMAGGKRYVIKSSLRKLKDRLEEELFIQCSRNHLVNFQCITKVDYVAGEITVDGQILPVGSIYRAGLEKKIPRL
jgi:DNA-binding LytR/AlgR family response regulator